MLLRTSIHFVDDKTYSRTIIFIKKKPQINIPRMKENILETQTAILYSDLKSIASDTANIIVQYSYEDKLPLTIKFAKDDDIKTISSFFLLMDEMQISDYNLNSIVEGLIKDVPKGDFFNYKKKKEEYRYLVEEFIKNVYYEPNFNEKGKKTLTLTNAVFNGGTPIRYGIELNRLLESKSSYQ